MKIAPKLLSIAFAITAIAAVSMPAAQPASAASGFDLKPVINHSYAFPNGTRMIWVDVYNVGDQPSAAGYAALYYCDYLKSNGQIERLGGDTVPVPGSIAPGGKDYEIPGGQCNVNNGRPAIKAGVTIAAPGDINNSNNTVEKKFV